MDRGRDIRDASHAQKSSSRKFFKVFKTSGRAKVSDSRKPEVEKVNHKGGFNSLGNGKYNSNSLANGKNNGYSGQNSVKKQNNWVDTKQLNGERHDGGCKNFLLRVVNEVGLTIVEEDHTKPISNGSVSNSKTLIKSESQVTNGVIKPNLINSDNLNRVNNCLECSDIASTHSINECTTENGNSQSCSNSNCNKNINFSECRNKSNKDFNSNCNTNAESEADARTTNDLSEGNRLVDESNQPSVYCASGGKSSNESSEVQIFEPADPDVPETDIRETDICSTDSEPGCSSVLPQNLSSDIPATIKWLQQQTAELKKQDRIIIRQLFELGADIHNIQGPLNSLSFDLDNPHRFNERLVPLQAPIMDTPHSRAVGRSCSSLVAPSPVGNKVSLVSSSCNVATRQSGLLSVNQSDNERNHPVLSTSEFLHNCEEFFV